MNRPVQALGNKENAFKLLILSAKSETPEVDRLHLSCGARHKRSFCRVYNSALCFIHVKVRSEKKTEAEDFKENRQIKTHESKRLIEKHPAGVKFDYLL